LRSFRRERAGASGADAAGPAGDADALAYEAAVHAGSLTAQQGEHGRGRNEARPAGLAAAADVVRVEEAALRELRARVAELPLEAQRDVAAVADTQHVQAR